MICSQCNKEFTKTHHRQKLCSKECSKINNKEWRKKYRQTDKAKEASKKYNKLDKAKEASKKYHKSKAGKKSNEKSDKKYQQSAKYLETVKKYNQSDRAKELKKITQKKYLQTAKGKETKNKNIRKYKKTDKFKKHKNKYERERRQSDPIFKLKGTIRARLRRFLKSSNIGKTNKTFELVGCTPEFLKSYLEKKFKPGMTWKNHTIHGWHVDHIIPIAKAKTSEDVKKLMNYTNLQPLWAIENIKKGDKY